MTEVRPDSVVLADGTALSSAITVWAGGFGVPALAAHSGLSVDADGRLLTDDTLTSMDDGRIVGAGDAVTTTSLPTRMSCYTANTTGAAAADTVLSRLADTEPAPFRLAYVGQCLSLGRGNAVLQFTRKDDSPVRLGSRNLSSPAYRGACAARAVNRERVCGSRAGPGPHGPPSTGQRYSSRDQQRRACRAVHPAAAPAVHHRVRNPGLGNRVR
ncbi:NADH dehydrogenase [Mycobacteroides abscessus subsp. massiliense]|nr:NADH dehydrogenase [Mycobacteroides abscessus subsp. massiliense]